MNHSSSVIASIRATHKAIIIAKPVDKIISQPTTKTTSILEQQLAQAAGAVTTHLWGGLSRCIALVLTKLEFWAGTGVTTTVVTCQAKPALVHPLINTNTTHYERMVKQELQKLPI